MSLARSLFLIYTLLSVCSYLMTAGGRGQWSHVSRLPVTRWRVLAIRADEMSAVPSITPLPAILSRPGLLQVLTLSHLPCCLALTCPHLSGNMLQISSVIMSVFRSLFTPVQEVNRQTSLWSSEKLKIVSISLCWREEYYWAWAHLDIFSYKELSV